MRVLAIGNCDGAIDALRAELAGRCIPVSVDRATDPLRALIRMGQQPPDAVVLDAVSLPNQARCILAAVRREFATEGRPVVMVIAPTGAAADWARRGADRIRTDVAGIDAMWTDIDSLLSDLIKGVSRNDRHKGFSVAPEEDALCR